jgi:hypothetical protein
VPAVGFFVLNDIVTSVINAVEATWESLMPTLKAQSSER